MTNIAEILKYAPQGLKLYSMIHGKVTLSNVDTTRKDYPIDIIDDQDDIFESLTKNGEMYIEHIDSECILFPSKEHKSWDNWQEILFKPGDFIICGVVNISKNQQNVCCIYNGFNEHYNDYAGHFLYHEGRTAENLNKQILLKNARYATPEERDKFFKELNANGYKWNYDTKQIEKIEQQNTPKFKVNEHIIGDDFEIYKVINIRNSTYTLYSYTTHSNFEQTIKRIDENYKLVTEQELVDAGIKEKPFTIDDLKPFDKVLTRNHPDSTWSANYYSHKDTSVYVCVAGFRHRYCIPYNDETKHLLGTTDDAPDKYKTW